VVAFPLSLLSAAALMLGCEHRRAVATAPLRQWAAATAPSATSHTRSPLRTCAPPRQTVASGPKQIPTGGQAGGMVEMHSSPQEAHALTL
jgi:hypothetical protein